MGKLGHAGVLPVRTEPTVTTKDVPISETNKYILTALTRFDRSLRALAKQVDDRTRPVDEYQNESTESPTGETTIEVMPAFDQIAERIESIIVTGPANTSFTLQVGDRYMTLTTDTRGMAVIAPVSMLLNRNDRRVLTSAVPGNWFFELMGWADERY